MNFGAEVEVVVRRLAEEGVAAGANGVIVPGAYLPSLKDLDTKFMIPGIRPSWFADDRHEKETKPEDVAGHDDVDVVCGVPIMEADDPVEALRQMLTALGQ